MSKIIRMEVQTSDDTDCLGITSAMNGLVSAFKTRGWVVTELTVEEES